MPALQQIVTKGATNVSVYLEIFDNTTGAPETGVVWNTSGIDLWYFREGAVHTSITEATTTEGAAHTDGGFIHISDGVYKLDVPDAAFATGVNTVTIGGTVTGMIVEPVVVQLAGVDVQDAVRGGMTALPNAAADAAGGLPISDAGGLALDTQLAATNEVTAARMGALTDWIDGGRLDLIVDAILNDTDLIDDGTSGLAKIATDVAAVLVDTAEIGTAGAGLTNINLPNQTMDIVGDITGNLSGSVGSVTGAVGSVTGHTNQTGDTFALANGAAGFVAIDTVVDAIKVVTDQLVAADSEPTGVPAVNETLLVKLAYLYMALRNQVTVTATKKTYFDDGGAAEWEKDLSDDGTTYTETEGNAI